MASRKQSAFPVRSLQGNEYFGTFVPGVVANYRTPVSEFIRPDDIDDVEVTATGSSAERELADRFADLPNIEDWRGHGGDPSDTAAFQAALNLSPDGTLRIRNQVYTLEETVVIERDNLTLEGPGRGYIYPLLAGVPLSPEGSRIILSAGFDGDYVFDFAPTGAYTGGAFPASPRALAQCFIRNLTIIGSAYTATPVTGIRWRVYQGGLNNVLVAHMSGDGMLGESVPGTGTTSPYAAFDNRIAQCRFKNNAGVGLKGDNIFSDNHITDVTCDYNGSHGIEMDNSSANMITRLYSYNNTGWGGLLHMWNTLVLGSRFQDNNGGLKLIGDWGGFMINDCKFRSNSVSADNTHDGIEISPTALARGGYIGGCDFSAGPGNADSDNRQRYGINITTADMNDVVIGPNSKSYITPATSAFGTSYIRDLGTNTKRLDAPSRQIRAKGQGLLSQNFDRGICAGGSIMVGGTAYAMLVDLRESDVITNVNLLGAGAGSGTTLFKAGIYAKGGGTLFASTADESAIFDANGFAIKVLDLSAPWTVPETDSYYIIIVSTASTTLPSHYRGFVSSSVGAVTGGVRPFATAGTGLTDLPATVVTYADANAINFWVGLN